MCTKNTLVELIAVILIAVLLTLLVISMASQKACSLDGSRLGLPSTYNLVDGCLVQSPSGTWLRPWLCYPLENEIDVVCFE